MLHAAIDGTVRCRACGRAARLDLFSRWVVSILIAVTLPSLLLYGQVFYSGHLFVISLVIVFAAWRLLSCIGLPFLALESTETDIWLRPRQSAFIAVALLLGAIAMDGFMASRFEPPEVAEQMRAPTAASREAPLETLGTGAPDRRQDKPPKLAL